MSKIDTMIDDAEPTAAPAPADSARRRSLRDRVLDAAADHSPMTWEDATFFAELLDRQTVTDQELDRAKRDLAEAAKWADDAERRLGLSPRPSIALGPRIGFIRDGALAARSDVRSGPAFAVRVAAELVRARGLHPNPINSALEGYGVIYEEFVGFFDATRAHQPASALLGELVQTAAMCQRTAEDLALADGKS